MADPSARLECHSVENVQSKDTYADFTWMMSGLTPDLKSIIESSDTIHAPKPEESSGVDFEPDVFDETDLQYSSQTTPNPDLEVFGSIDPDPDASDDSDLQYPLLTTTTARSLSPLVHDSLLGGSSSALDNIDFDAVGEVIPYIPMEASSSAFLPEVPFRFSSEEHHPGSLPAPSFNSHNALQLDIGVDSPAFAQSGSVTIQQPASPRPSRVRTSNVALPEVSEENMGSDSGDDANDEEYVPFTRSTTRTHCRVARSSAYASHVPSKRPRPVLPPRNIQLRLPFSSPISSPGSTLPSFISEANPWLCVCGWEQKNHRASDLRRHIRSHMQSTRPARWVCRGVPPAQAPAHASGLRKLVHNGQIMVGGCNKAFSRRDALKRHLQNENNHCIGEVVEQSPSAPLL